MKKVNFAEYCHNTPPCLFNIFTDIMYLFPYIKNSTMDDISIEYSTEYNFIWVAKLQNMF